MKSPQFVTQDQWNFICPWSMTFNPCHWHFMEDFCFSSNRPLIWNWDKSRTFKSWKQIELLTRYCGARLKIRNLHVQYKKWLVLFAMHIHTYFKINVMWVIYLEHYIIVGISRGFPTMQIHLKKIFSLPAPVLLIKLETVENTTVQTENMIQAFQSHKYMKISSK